ncbi:MAG: biofilm PGA synthesis N-glycosyltransferase PgaC [Cryomorphaceae bacterium]|jgi:cellulose synthase/poly-beta-1,6-N-acetylglucosamine synthase-like glycosyltransferase
MEINISSESVIIFWGVLLIASAAIQFGFLFLVYSRLAFFKNPKKSEAKPPVSIIIAARNEEENLLVNMPIILEQDYPEFEVIVINDSSVDDSITVLKAFEEKYPNLRVINIHENDRYEGGKKYAITLGVKGAKYERLIFTDADCKPVSRKWVEKVIESVAIDGAIVLGYSPYSRKPGFLNKVIRYDAFNTGLNYLSFALCGIPYMGVGRNLSYSKSSFFSVGGFKSHYKLLSGDDDLLINQIARKENTFICVDKEAEVQSDPEKSWRSYWLQKRRHLTTGSSYRFHHRFLLILQPVSLLLFWLAAIVLLVSHNWLEITLIIVLTRILAQILIFRRSSRCLGQADLTILAPIFEIIILILTACAHTANAVSNRITWKT